MHDYIDHGCQLCEKEVSVIKTYLSIFKQTPLEQKFENIILYL